MAEYHKGEFNITTDAVVFTVMHDDLKILLVKRSHDPFKDKFALPGGFVKIGEGLDEAMKRKLEDETGVKNIFLKKLHAFGEVDRDPRARVVTVPYLALIDGERVKVHARSPEELTRWYSVYDLPDLAFDHKKIIEDALRHLRFETENTNIAYQIMADKFTLTELQKTYEVILDTKLDKRNFRKKLKELDLVIELDETKMEGAHRPAKLHSFKDKEYKML